MKVIKVSIPIYHGTLQIVIAEDFNEAAKKLKISDNGHDLECFGAFVNVTSFGNGLDFFTAFFKKDVSNSLIAHEVVHLVNGIYRERHMELDKRNDEPQAYLTGWITGEIYKALKK